MNNIFCYSCMNNSNNDDGNIRNDDSNDISTMATATTTSRTAIINNVYDNDKILTKIEATTVIKIIKNKRNKKYYHCCNILLAKNIYTLIDSKRNDNRITLLHSFC